MCYSTKAFDTVSHDKLISILTSLGFRGHFAKIITSFLSNKKFRIRCNDKYSNYMKICTGVPQGAILSPLLYTLYKNNLTHVFDPLIQYADDCSLIISYSNLDHLQKCIDTVSHRITNYFSSLDLHLNTSKTEIILFGESSTYTLNFCQSPIKTSKVTKFLGMHISNNFKFDHHILHHVCPIIKRLYSSLFQLQNVTNRHSKHLVLNAYILPHILYSIPFILNINESTRNRLDKIYKKGIKILFNLPMSFPSTDLYHKTGCHSLDKYIFLNTSLYAFKIFHNICPFVICSSYIRTPRYNFIRGLFIQLSHTCKQLSHIRKQLSRIFCVSYYL